MKTPPPHDLEVLQAVAQGTLQTLGKPQKAIENSLSRSRSKYKVGTIGAAIIIATSRGDLPSPNPATPRAPLNEWEMQLLRLVAEDYSRAERREALQITQGQYLTLVNSIKLKLHASSLEQATYNAYGLGLLNGERRPRSPRPYELRALVATTQHENLEDTADALGMTPSNLRDLIRKASIRLTARTTPHAIAIAIRLELIPVIPAQDSIPRSWGRDDQVALWALSRGMKSADLKDRLHCSVLAAEKLTREMLQKIGTKSRPRAVLWGFQHGLLQ